MSDLYDTQGLKRGPLRLLRIFACALALVAALLFVLPLTQHLMQVQDQRTVRSVDLALPPPPPPPPEPPPPVEEKVEEPPPELKQPPRSLSLSQLELAMNPGMGGAMGGAFLMEGFEMETNALADLQTFSVAELDEAPRLTRQPTWSWPRHVIGRIREDVNAYAIIIINERGEVAFDRFRNLTHPIIESELIAHIEGFRFTRPTKDGQPVRARFAIPLELPKPQ